MNEFEIVIRLVLALFLGSLLGVERVYAGKSAGIRTLGLVSLGAASFIIISIVVLDQYGYAADPLRMAASVVTGIGFLGAGMIIFQNDHLANLTTAAGVWVAAAIGIASGFGMYFTAIIITMLVIVTFTFMWNLENKVRHHFQKNNQVYFL